MVLEGRKQVFFYVLVLRKSFLTDGQTAWGVLMMLWGTCVYSLQGSQEVGRKVILLQTSTIRKMSPARRIDPPLVDLHSSCSTSIHSWAAFHSVIGHWVSFPKNYLFILLVHFSSELFIFLLINLCESITIMGLWEPHYYGSRRCKYICLDSLFIFGLWF